MLITTICPKCGETDSIELNEEETVNYFKWRDREMLIQDALPHRTATEREQLITGFCPSCQKEIFK